MTRRSAILGRSERFTSEEQQRRIEDLAEIFAALGDPTRLRILSALASHERCVCDLSAEVGISPSNCSHQLRILRSLRLVRGRRQGKHVFYTTEDEHVRRLVEQGLEHVSEAS